MQIRLSQWLLALRLLPFGLLPFGLLGTIAAPAQAQFSDAQVGSLVDALGQAGEGGDRTLTDWQLDNIGRWSNKCIGRSLTPEQFQSSPVTARWITTCMVKDVLKTEFRLSGNKEAIAVRRTAAWWSLGDPNRFNSGETAAYTQKVLSLYQKKPASTAAAPTSPSAPTANSKPAKPTISAASSPGQAPAAATTPNSSTDTFYDRYMKAGYAATNRRDNPTALLYFKRALDERPDDSYAAQAIRNVEGYLGQAAAKPIAAAGNSKPAAAPTTPKNAAATTPPAKLAPPKTPPTVKPAKTTAPTAVAPTAVVVVPAAPTSDAFNEQQAIALINRWLQAKAEVFAPPYDQQQIVNLTTGELLTSLMKPDGVLNWLKLNRAYFRYGAQKVDSIERFVVARDRATIELNMTEDRTLYLNGVIDPNQTDFSRQRLRFTFEAVDGTWKIADYKTVNGSLLERSIVR